MRKADFRAQNKENRDNEPLAQRRVGAVHPGNPGRN